MKIILYYKFEIVSHVWNLFKSKLCHYYTFSIFLQENDFIANCGVSNEFFNIPTDKNHKCGSNFLKKRVDDNEEILRDRFKTYNEQTAPILEYYKSQNLFVEIDGMLEIEQIHGKIREIIHSWSLDFGRSIY